MGRNDATVPPFSDTEDETMSESNDGWYYNTARNVTDRWGFTNGCDAGDYSTAEGWGIDGFADAGKLECVQLSNCDGGADVVECIFDSGHVCNKPYIRDPMIAFMLSHQRLVEPSSWITPSPTITATTNASSSASSRYRRSWSRWEDDDGIGSLLLLLSCGTKFPFFVSLLLLPLLLPILFLGLFHLPAAF